MDMEILQEKENKLLERKELEIRMQYSGATPSRKEIRQAVGQKLGVDPETVAIRRIGNAFGKPEIVIETNVYPTKQLCEQYEPAYVTNRYKEKPAEGEKKEEAATEEKKEGKENEKPKEKAADKKEEAKKGQG